MLPAVNKAFAAIIPGIAAIYTSAIVAFLAFALTGQAINDLVSTYIQMPLMGLSQGLGSVILLTFLVQLFWFFDLHGHNVLAPVMDGLVSLFNLLISFLIWLPFVISANKVKAD